MARTVQSKTIKRVKPKPKQEPPCHLCTAHCCQYFALQIDEPEDEEDFENIKWYVIHQGAMVFVEDGDWFLEVQSRCQHLGQDNKCQIYHRRPQICRDYGLDEDGDVNCHMAEDLDLDYEHTFTTLEEVEAYAAKVLEPTKKRKR